MSSRTQDLSYLSWISPTLCLRPPSTRTPWPTSAQNPPKLRPWWGYPYGFKNPSRVSLHIDENHRQLSAGPRNYRSDHQGHGRDIGRRPALFGKGGTGIYPYADIVVSGLVLQDNQSGLSYVFPAETLKQRRACWVNTHWKGSGAQPLPTQTIEARREELTTGYWFARQYQMIEELGKGGMGKVYRASDKKTLKLSCILKTTLGMKS